MGSPWRASTPHVAHGVGVPSDQITAELSMVCGTGQPLIGFVWFLTSPYASSLPHPTLSVLCQAKALLISNAT